MYITRDTLNQFEVVSRMYTFLSYLGFLQSKHFRPAIRFKDIGGELHQIIAGTG